MQTLDGIRVFRILRTAALGTLIGAMFLTGGTAQATLLNLSETYPDIFCNSITVDYLSSTRTLTTTYGNPAQFTYQYPGDPGQFIYQDQANQEEYISTLVEPDVYTTWPQCGFTINMVLGADNKPISGSLEIRGYIPDLQGDPPNWTANTLHQLANASQLLTGNIADFGYDELGSIDTLEFVFTSTGGFLNDRFFPGQIGVELQYTGFTGSFEEDFHSDNLDLEYLQVSQADVFLVPIPEPSSGILLITSLGSLLFISIIRRLRRN